MTAEDFPGVVDSRAFFTTDTMFRRVTPKVGDTTTMAISLDSSRVRFVIVRRPKNTTNLRLRVYQLRVTADSTVDFTSLDPYFTSTPVVDAVVTQPYSYQATAFEPALPASWTLTFSEVSGPTGLSCSSTGLVTMMVERDENCPRFSTAFMLK